MRALILSAALFALPVAVQAQDHGHAGSGAHQDHRHADFRSGRFHVRVEGTEGPHLILIPGLSSAPPIWDGLIARLEGPHRIHVLHVQGFAGAAPMDNATGPVAAPVAEDLARYIREQGIENPIVIGHSMGGTIALMLAARHPDLVGRLMIVDQIPFMGQAFGGPGATPQSVTPVADGLRATYVGATPDQWRAMMTAGIGRAILSEPMRAGPIAQAIASDQTVSADALHELIVTDLRPELAAVTAPTRVLYIPLPVPGVSAEQTDALYRAAYAAVPGVTLKRIDGAGHFIMLDQPDAFAAEVNAFLD